MATAFDPTLFIQAEEARLSQAVAAAASVFTAPADTVKPAEICCFRAPDEPALATIATLAGPRPKILDWDPELRDFIDGDRPSIIAAELWDELIEETWDVHRHWGSAAVDAGWTVLDLFGCDPHPTSARVDRNGLVASIVRLKTPVRITALDERSATLQPQTGSPMRYYRSPAPGAVPLWVAYRALAPP